MIKPNTTIPSIGAVLGLLMATGLAEQRSTQELTPIGTVTLPPSGEAQLKVDLLGESQVRAGEEYQYQLRATNVSPAPLYEVKLYQTTTGGFNVSQADPKPDADRRPPSAKAREKRIEGLMEKNQNMSTEKGEAPQETAEQKAERRPQQTRKSRPNGQKAQAKNSDTRPARNRPDSWTIGLLKPGETRAVTISGVPAKEGNLNLCAYATYAPALCAEVRVTAPELALKRRFVDNEGNPEDLFFICDTFGVEYEVTNKGTGTIQDARVIETLPSGLRTADGKNEINLSVGELSAGESVTKTVSLNAERTGSYRSAARATAGELAAKSETQSVELIRPELELSVSGPSEAYLNRTIEYEVQVTNASASAPAFDTVVSMPGLDQELRLVASDRTVGADIERFALGTLEPGESRSFKVAFESAEAGQIATKVTANAYCAEASTKELATTLKGIPAVQVMVVDGQDPVPVGETTTYEVKVWNEGTAKDVDLKLSGELPKGAEFVEAYGDTQVEANGNKVSFGKVKELHPGDSASWTIQVRGKEAGRVRFKTELTSQAVVQGLTSSEPTTIY